MYELKILMLEDLSSDIELVKYELKKAGIDFILVSAETEEEFLRQLSLFAPDIILADYSLPEFNGLEALKILKKLEVNIPFILVTGTQTDEVAVECMKQGADDYILKTGLRRLPSAILNAINKQRIKQENEHVKEELRKSEEHYRLITENTHDLISTLDIEGNYLYVSPSYKEILGYKPAELIGRNSLDFIHPDDKARVIVAWKSALATLRSKTVEFRYRHNNGDWYFFEGVGKWIFDKNGSASKTVIISRDITQRKAYEEQLRDTTEKLRSLTTHLQTAIENERTRISREIHDELGQLMTALKMDLSLLSRKVSNAQGTEDIPAIQEEIKKMSGLADLNIQTIRKIATELRPDFLDNLGLLSAMQWQIEDFQRRTGIKCSLDIPSEDINLDEDRTTAIFRVFQETMTNVARHASAQKVSIRMAEEGEKLILEVADDGVGINQNRLKEIKSLGLLGMRERMHQFKGEILINSNNEDGKGTKITAILPLK
jgi:two-component system sensor histidine kinase UhpB